MRGKWFVAGASVALAGLVAIGVTLLSRLSKPEPRAAPTVAHAAPPAPEIQLTGKIRARNIVNVAPPLEGTVGAFFADVGQEVFEGQLLARLSNEGLESGQETAQRTVENAQARIDTLESEIVAARLEASRSRADATRARSEYERMDRVYRRQQTLFAEGATPRLTYEKANRDFDLTQSEYRSLEQVAAAAEARVDDLRKNLDSEKRALAEKSADLESAKTKLGAAEVLALAQGIIVARNGEVGRAVAPDKVDFFQIATQLSQLEVVLDPDPRSMPRIQPGQAALVSLPDQGADGMLGAVKSIEGTQVIVAFTSPNPAVRPGMLAQVRIKVT
jgi:multidrug resistance efflux pump